MPGGMAPGDQRDACTELGQAALAYADTMHSFARYLTGNLADAEDLVQETYSRALRAADQFTPGSNLKAWLFRILRNAYISGYRRRRLMIPRWAASTLSAPGVSTLGDQQRWLRG